MNKKIENPLTVQFMAAEENPLVKRTKSGAMLVPVNTPYNMFSGSVISAVKDYDSVLVHVSGSVDRDEKGAMNSLSVKMNGLMGAGNRADKPVLTYESAGKPMYWMNPAPKDRKEASQYAPEDTVVLGKYESFGSNDAWQEHQGKLWSRMADMMPLSRKADEYSRNHAAQLLDPKRGLEERDLKKFWSFKSGVPIAPTMMGDDMVGMPSVEGRTYDGFVHVEKDAGGTVTETPIQVRSLHTFGTTGIAIPMANTNGDVSKHQVAADLNSYNTVLHFRAEDGKTIGKRNLFDKKTREYAFTFEDGTPTKLVVEHVDMNEEITMSDSHGSFHVRPKQEMIDVLKDRGYVIPDLIASVKPVANGKYMWQSPGTMTGSKEALKIVSPSNPGFIVARGPKGKEDSYDVLVAEGALKGHIVAKYVDVKDKDGICFGDQLSDDRGIIVVQVPGVAKAFVENVPDIYAKYPVHQTYIAMDADGRENRNVAMGIASAYECLNERNPSKVLCWDPAQKGLDDALLAVAQGNISIKDMDLVTGTAEELFPIENAQKMVAHKLEISTENPHMEETTPKQEEPVPEQDRPGPEQKSKSIQISKTFEKIKKWDAENLEMEPVSMPPGYKSVYQYRQAVIRKETMPLNLKVKPVYQHRGDWGVLNLESDHVIGQIEKEDIKTVLESSGMELVGDMKLTHQIMSRDNSMQPAKEDAMQI